MTITELRVLNAAQLFCLDKTVVITCEPSFPVAVLMPYAVFVGIQGMIGRAEEVVDEIPGLREAIAHLGRMDRI